MGAVSCQWKMNVTKVLLLIALFPLQLMAAEILVISSYHQANLWDQSYSAGLKKHLKGEHHISHFYMDTKRRPHDEFDLMAEQALAFYRQLKPDLVVLDGALTAEARPDGQPGACLRLRLPAAP